MTDIQNMQRTLEMQQLKKKKKKLLKNGQEN